MTSMSSSRLFTLMSHFSKHSIPVLAPAAASFRRTSISTSSPFYKSATDFLDFVNASPSPFHAVEESRKRLLSAGFTELRERDSWSLVPGGKYFFTRNKSSITAFAVGGKYVHGNGFSIVGAHTDSPCLKVKPRSKKEKAGYLQVGVELYGGGLWNTWFDRDLGIAGRVVIQNGDKFEHRLVCIDEPILRIPTLAIHLDRTVISDGFKFNTEVQLTPILCSAAKAALTGDVPKTEVGEEKHQPLLLKALAKELSINALEIGDFELCLFDTQPSRIGGLLNEYIFSPRLDNLNSSYCALTGLINAGDLENDTKVRMVSLFDNEEVGSVSAYGADSDLLLKAIRRIQEEVAAPGTAKATFERALAQSYLISADMAHAVHPNYPEKFEENHRPQMNKGVVIKQNANQKYATTAVTTFLLREVAKVRNVPLQEFVVRNDSPCGSTIGPMLSAKLGIRTIDVGNPQLSMHSIRETCGTDDVKYATDLFQSFFEHFHTIDAKLSVD